MSAVRRPVATHRPDVQHLLTAEKQFLESTMAATVRLKMGKVVVEELGASRRKLDELFWLVVVGEFNSGKSSLINALLGKRYLKEGVLPTTDTLHLIRKGPQVERWHSPAREGPSAPQVVNLAIPSPFLDDLIIADTPGVNSIVESHQHITENVIPQSDLVLFVTSVERAMSASERDFLRLVESWSKKIVVIVNKVDLLSGPEEVDRLRSYVYDSLDKTFASQSRSQIEENTTVLFVSCRKAMEEIERAELRPGEGSEGRTTEKGGPIAKSTAGSTSPSPSLGSNFDALRDFIVSQLSSVERIRLKLSSPLGVVDKILGRCQEIVEKRKEVLQGDVETLRTIDTNLDVHEQEMLEDFKHQQAGLDNVLFELEVRGLRFFDSKLQLSNFVNLMRTQQFQAAFESEVVAETSLEVERCINRMIDWIVERKHREWKLVTTMVQSQIQLGQSTDTYSQNVSGIRGFMEKNPITEFDFSRQRLLETLGRTARETADIDKETAFSKINSELRGALFSTLVLSAGWVSVGTLTAVLMPSALLDLVGFAGAGTMLVSSLVILPYKRKKMKDQFEANLLEIRDKLRRSLDRIFQEELRASIESIQQTISPYSRFVKVEIQTAEEEVKRMKSLRQEADYLREEIEKLKN